MRDAVSRDFFTVCNLALRFGGIQAISDLSFSVARGEVFAIIGPNGAGKTSVFNLITRVFDASAGAIVFEGSDVTRVARHCVVKHGIARTFQNIALFDGASVLDNLLLGRHRFAHGNFLQQLVYSPRVSLHEAAAREQIESIIDLLALAPYRHSLVSGLPYGIRKMVELGRALATEPKLLLLDEPASGLNPEETRDLAFLLDDIRSDLGITVIMIEHDMSLVSDTADRVLVMNQGMALATGTPGEVQADPQVIAAYLGG